MSDLDLDERLGRLARASENIRARSGFNEAVVLAALSSAPASLGADLSRSLRRMVPLAVLAAALSVLWAVTTEQGTDDAFAAADETVELEW